MINGKIIKGIGGFYYVETAEAVYECKARGNFRKMNLSPLVGDNRSDFAKKKFSCKTAYCEFGTIIYCVFHC